MWRREQYIESARASQRACGGGETENASRKGRERQNEKRGWGARKSERARQVVVLEIAGKRRKNMGEPGRKWARDRESESATHTRERM